MKKILTISGILTMLFLGVLLLTPTILSVFGIDKQLKEYITNRLSSDKGTLFIIDKINFGFGKIELGDIRFISQSSDFDILINSIDFDYNIFKLITNPNDPHKAIDKIYLISPKLILKNLDVKNGIAKLEHDSTTTNIFEILNQFDNIDKIFIKNGSIALDKPNSEYIGIAQRLNGWVDSRDFSAVTLKAKGDIFDSFDRSFNLECVVDLVAKEIFATIELNNFNLKNVKFIYEQNGTNIQDGKLSGKLEITNNSFSLDGLIVNGQVSLSNYCMNLYETNIHELEISSSVRNNQLSIEKGEGFLDQSKFSVTGKINNIFNPEFIGKFDCSTFELKSISTYINTTILDQNKISLLGDLVLSPSSYRFNLDINSPRLLLGTQPVEHFKSSLRFEDGDVSIESLKFKSYGFDFTTKGHIDLHSGDYKGQIVGDRYFGEHLFYDRLTGANQELGILVQGNIPDQTLNGNWQYNIKNKVDSVFSMEGLINLDNEKFNFSMKRNAQHDCFFSLQVIDIFKEPIINYGYIENLPFYLFTSKKWVSDLFRKYQFEGIIVGSLSDFNSKISITEKSDPSKEFALTCRVSNLLETFKKIHGKLTLDKFIGDYSFDLGEEFIRGYFDSGEECKAKLDINLSRSNQINSSVEFTNFNFNQFYHDSLLSGYGEISGEVIINGTLDNPFISANLCGDKFIFNNVGYYKFDLLGNYKDENVNIESLQLALNNTPILKGNLKIDLPEQSVDLKAFGEKVSADYIFQTLFQKKGMVKGIGNYNLDIHGSVQSPKIYTNIEIVQGEFDNIPFDIFQLQVRDSLADGENFLEYKNHMLNIDQFSLIKGGHYHIEGLGNLPLFKHGKIDFEIKFDGDILSMIPVWDDFFIDGASFATIQLNIAGTPGKPIIKKGVAQIEKGELWLSSVVDHIENIEGKIELKEGTNEIIFSGITAEVNGKPLIINTVQNITTSDDQELEPWYFKDLDLDFGILEMKTLEGGIELQIDGFMIDGEKGMISLSGKTESEKFYFAGPVRTPHAWGNIEFSDSRFTFPFIKKNTGKPTKAVEFLRNIYWDVNVTAGKDLHYLRDVPAILGKVDTKLNIDPLSEGLKFKGIIDKHTFQPAGKLTSSRGRIEYLDLNFRVDNFGIDFNTDSEDPEVYGRAWTAVRDSVGAVPRTIYLELYTVNEETGFEDKRARWEEFRFRLVPADKIVGETQEEILAYLGYSVQNIKEKAKQVGGAVTENYIIRPLLRPLERSLERYLGFDLVRFNSSIAKNLFLASLGQKNARSGVIGRTLNATEYSPYLFLFESSELTVGKYLTQDLYFTYTGQLVATSSENQNEFSFNHSVGVEYRFFKNLLLEVEYDREVLDYYRFYSDKSYQEDLKIRLRHSFSF